MNESAGSTRIEVIAPSGAVLSGQALATGLERLRALGCTVHSRVPERPWSRFADTDDGRLAQIHDAARAPDTDVVMIARGGYGLSRLLEHIDWQLVSDSVRRGVRWVGFSDFTAFHLGLLAKTGAASWAGPAVCGDFGQGEPEPYMLDQFRRLLRGETPDVEWAASTDFPESKAQPESAPGGGQTRDGFPAEGLEGTLWGGNLAMLCSLVGTSWLPDVKDGLLFLEDVSEHPYRVERMLLQLLHAGVLPQQRAILLGAFTGWTAASHDEGYALATAVNHVAARLSIPVIQGLPFGHIRKRAVLGVGLQYCLESCGSGWRLRALPMAAPASGVQIRPSSTA